jgi:hypothetical protein
MQQVRRKVASKDSFYEELEQVFSHIPKYHTKILLGDLNAKLGIKLTIGNDSLHQNSNNNGIRIGNFTTSKSSLRARCSCTKTFINAPGPLLM